MAKKYYAKLFKEYAIADLSRYKVPLIFLICLCASRLTFNCMLCNVSSQSQVCVADPSLSTTAGSHVGSAEISTSIEGKACSSAWTIVAVMSTALFDPMMLFGMHQLVNMALNLLCL